MAQTVHLSLEIDGNAIEGESTIASMEREGTIECASFKYGLITPRETATGALTGRRQHSPCVITKRIDKSTPLLLKALCQNEPVTNAKFRFFRPSLEAGAEEHFFTVLLESGYVGSVKQLSEDVVMAGKDAPPMMEEVSFVFQDITWTYEIGGATHKDSWRGEA
jgi:type VI secretion system secreted protein Hcp